MEIQKGETQMIIRKYYLDPMTGDEYYQLRDDDGTNDYLMRTDEERSIILRKDSGDIFYHALYKREIKKFKQHEKELELRKMFMPQDESLISKFNTYYVESEEHFKELQREKRRRQRLMAEKNKEWNIDPLSKFTD